MHDIINIIYFSTSIELITSLTLRLKRDNKKVRGCLLEGEGPFNIADFVRKDVYMNVVFLCHADLEKLNLEELDSLPDGKSFVPDKSLSVLFYLGEGEPDSRFYDHFVVKRNLNSLELIRRELVVLYNKREQERCRYSVFVGRRNEIEQFQNLLYSERSYRTNAVFVSGRIGVGREAFVRECISMTREEVDYEPYFLSLGPNGNVEMLIIQLNSILHVYEEKSLRITLNQAPHEKTDVAVRLLNKMFESNDYLVIYDEFACLQRNRKLSEWFKTVVLHPNLGGHMQLYVISTISVNYFRARDEEGVAYFTLYSLTLSERKWLLYKHLSNKNLKLNESDVQFFAENLQYSPNQIVQVVEDIVLYGSKHVKQNIAKYQTIGDNKARPLIKKYDDENFFEAINVLAFLSKLEFASEKLLKTVFGNTFDEVKKEIDQFSADGIVERFGTFNDFVRLDSYFRDYFLRNRIDYADKSLKNHINERLSRIISDEPQITYDYSAFMYAVKQRIEENIVTDNSYLISSVMVNCIIESYHKHKWEQVVILCEKVFERNPNYFSDVFRVIRYWYCLALARLKLERKFYENVKEFDGEDAHFLKGFFFRNKQQYNSAEDEYRKTLKINPVHQRAKKEMVVCLMAQGKFSTALPIARENHIRNTENAYLLHAYYRCLVRKRNMSLEEQNELRMLLNECKENKYLPTSYVDGVQFEYDCFINPLRLSKEDLLVEAIKIENIHPRSSYIKELVSELRYECGVGSNIISMEYDDEFGA